MTFRNFDIFLTMLGKLFKFGNCLRKDSIQGNMVTDLCLYSCNVSKSFCFQFICYSKIKLENYSITDRFSWITLRLQKIPLSILRLVFKITALQTCNKCFKRILQKCKTKYFLVFKCRIGHHNLPEYNQILITNLTKDYYLGEGCRL